jgi:predicted N-acetyltransferase YhbS|tara:strand:- start:1567 stop:2055 length:489 start_codon:yes stop_codon:yes gene_type:complete
MKNIRLAHDKDLKNIEKLLDEAFGPGRYARTAYRYREKHNLISEYSYIYQDNKQLLASISFSQIFINNINKGLLLGPLAVKPGHDGKGYGVALVETTIKLIKKSKKYNFIVLVGDIDYYRRFNFKQILQPLNLVGPVNPNRVLILSLDKKMKINKLEKIELT